MTNNWRLSLSLSLRCAGGQNSFFLHSGVLAVRTYHKVRQKMEALRQKSLGLPHTQICQLVGITGNTLRAYLQEYQEGGVETIRKIRFYHPPSELVSYTTSLKPYFRKHPPVRALEAADPIEKLTGIQLSPKRVREFMKPLGFNRLKVGPIPAKADPDKQEALVNEELEPRLEEAMPGNEYYSLIEPAGFQVTKNKLL